MSDYISKQADSLGTEVLSAQLIDEVERHAKTVASNIRLSREVARLREALVLIEDESSHEDACITKINGLAQDALSGDTEPVGAQLRDYVVAASSYRNTISEALAIWESMDSFDDAGDVMDKVIDRLRVGINTGEGQQSGDS